MIAALPIPVILIIIITILVCVNLGHGTAGGGRLPCTEDNSRVRIPNAPPNNGRVGK